MQPAPTPPAVDDTKVQKYIDDALAAAGGDLQKAWQKLDDAREDRNHPENCFDQNLAAADHYMFARHLEVDTPFPYLVIEGAIYLYGLSKMIGGSFAAGGCPPSPTSGDQVRWALRGLSDGQLDLLSPGDVPD